MKDFELVYNFQRVEDQLFDEGYEVSPVKTAFFVMDKQGKIVADCQTVDGLRGFLQGIQWAKEL